MLNAALCDSSITCDADRKFWMWAGQKVFTPTEDPSNWNSLVLFSRRGHGAPIRRGTSRRGTRSGARPSLVESLRLLDGGAATRSGRVAPGGPVIRLTLCYFCVISLITRTVINLLVFNRDNRRTARSGTSNCLYPTRAREPAQPTGGQIAARAACQPLVWPKYSRRRVKQRAC